MREETPVQRTGSAPPRTGGAGAAPEDRWTGQRTGSATERAVGAQQVDGRPADQVGGGGTDAGPVPRVRLLVRPLGRGASACRARTRTPGRHPGHPVAGRVAGQRAGACRWRSGPERDDRGGTRHPVNYDRLGRHCELMHPPEREHPAPRPRLPQYPDTGRRRTCPASALAQPPARRPPAHGERAVSAHVISRPRAPALPFPERTTGCPRHFLRFRPADPALRLADRSASSAPAPPPSASSSGWSPARRSSPATAGCRCT